jgi:Ca-activated chloride channel family protein
MSSGSPSDPNMALLPRCVSRGTLLIVPLLTATLAAGQFTSGVNLVEVYATVTDAQGQPVPGLSAANFRVSEDGAPQAITAFVAGDFPLSIVVVLDRSFSMSGDRLNLAKQAARLFIGALRPDDEVMVLAAGSEIETITPPVPARTAATTAWDAIQPWGTTPLYDVIAQSLDMPYTQTRRRALLVVSDGFDRYSDITEAGVLERARHRDVLVYPVAIGKARPPVLAELASVTGGHSFTVDDPKKLETTLNTIARELRSQYLLGYAPARAPKSNSEWRSIEVSVDRPGARVRARDGYYAK